MKVLVTGASGVLGSAIYAAFKQAPERHTVLGLAHSRATGDLKALDLLKADEVDALVREFRPDWIVHCAAERKPDVAEKDPEGTQKLNVSVPEHLAKLAKELGSTLIYISTDYVFDGTSPPYVPSARTNPLNIYGRTKRDGELAVLGVEGARGVVLRVPVLYGPAPHNADSAVNILLDVVQDQSGKQYKMDHYQTRYPTNVLDIAAFLVRLARLPRTRHLPPILHYTAPEPFTKYEMCLIFARILGVPHAHIVPDANPPAPGATPRPHDTQLYVRETEDLGVEGGLGTTGFEEWWEEHLGKK
ncbi:NAD-P-binding protein, partial [Dentipellis sp. KUC8613]